MTISEIKEQLKKEFFGIDEQIESVVNSIETWLEIKEYQTRPMTICLWGLTGTGKTALVNRAIELFDLNKKRFYIKFGSKTSGIADDLELNNCSDTIFVLDEFQYFKTKKENGEEIERDEDNSTNMVWELLDGGVVNLYGLNMTYSYEKAQISGSLYVLKELQYEGATINNGIVYHKNLNNILKKFFIENDTVQMIEDEKNSNNINTTHKGPYFTHDGEEGLEEAEYDSVIKSLRPGTKDSEISMTEIRLKSLFQVNVSVLYEFLKYKDLDYSFLNKQEFFHFLKNIKDLKTIINFLEDVKNSKPKLNKRDYSKSMIFVIGNLDECFSMSNNLTSDLDADYFYKKTKQISIIDIRKSLLKRFRPEQIARLGSTHIIYPSLTKQAFNSIISKELNSFGSNAMSKINKDYPNKIDKIVFTDKIKKLIYKEGVFPVIGARSVFSTINEIVVDKLTHIIKTVIDLKKDTDITIEFDYTKKNILVKYINSDGLLVSKNDFKYITKIDNLRIEKDKGKQAHRAVHEAGHAVSSIVLESVFPEVIYSVVLDGKDSGFNLMNYETSYYHRVNTFRKRVSTLLSGFAAESIVFGDENITNGSSSDFDKATTLVLSLLKDSGFNYDIGRFSDSRFLSSDYETTNYTLIENGKLNEKAYDIIKDCYKTAKETLKNQETLFLKISEYLTNNPKMSSSKIKEYTKKYIKGIKYEDILKNNNDFFYEKLNEMIKNNGE